MSSKNIKKLINLDNSKEKIYICSLHIVKLN
jgi:hypothetical protein